MNVVIETRDLVKVYKNGTVALNGIDLRIERGTIFSFLGPNGAGKTTTVRILSSLIKPTSGTVEVLGMPVASKGVEIRKRIGVLSENHGLYESMSVEKNLRFFAGFYFDNREIIDENVGRLLEEFDLTERKDDKVGQLSKGLRQRAALIKTLVHDPEIVFLDEPTSGLDPKAAVELREYIKSYTRGRDKTVFICTHNLNEAQKLSDLVAIIDEGKIKRMGAPGELERQVFESTTFVIQSTTKIPEKLVENLREKHGMRIKMDGTTMKLFVQDDAVNETIPALVKELVTANVPILQVYRETRTLEDVYLKLIDQDGDGTMPASNGREVALP